MHKDIDFGFLFGAGTSQALGLPGTEKLTHEILGSLLTCHSNKRFHIAGTLPQGGLDCVYHRISRKEAQKVQTFLGWLWDFINDFNARYPELSVDPNFESIYSICHQIAECLRGYQVNPALSPLLSLLDVEGKPFYEFRPDLLTLASESTDYIKDVAAALLNDSDDAFNDHDFVENALNARNGKSLDLFSLNFDLQIEKYCEARELHLVDGFGQSKIKNGVRHWDPSQYRRSEGGIHLFKLHGSINWYYWAPYDDPWHQKLGISTAPSWEETILEDNKRAYPLDQPAMLVGLQNKVLAYSSGWRLELLCSAKEAWDRLHVLVIVGYSFRDQGINRLLYDWGDKDGNRKFIAICRNKQNFLRKSASVFGESTFREWEMAGKLIIYEKDFKNLEWGEIEQILTRITK